jgi:hypothetical protein
MRARRGNALGLAIAAIGACRRTLATRSAQTPAVGERSDRPYSPCQSGGADASRGASGLSSASDLGRDGERASVIGRWRLELDAVVEDAARSAPEGPGCSAVSSQADARTSAASASVCERPRIRGVEQDS